MADDRVATAIGLDHVVLVVADVEATLSWYQRHAGLDGVRVEEWRAGAAPFPSLRVDETTIIDLIPGHDGGRGHLDHVCFVVADPGLDAVRVCPDCTVEDEGPRFGARGMGTSVYVRDPDGLLVEFRTYG